MFLYNFNLSSVYVRLEIFSQCLLLLRHSNLFVAQRLICSSFPSHKWVLSMLPLVFISIESIYSKIGTCRQLAGFKSQWRSDLLAKVAHQGKNNF